MNVNTLTTLIPLIVLAAFMLGLLAFLRWHLRDGRRAQMQADLHKRLVDRFESPQELAAFLASEGGARLLGTQSQTVHERVLGAVQAGCILTLGGSGITSAGAIAQNMFLFGLGIVAAGIGLGFFVAAGVCWLLARRWGLVPQR
jgi:hypothetical protein